MEFYLCSPSETFVLLTADQFVGCDDGLLEQQRQDILVCRKKLHISSDLTEKIRVLTTKATKEWNS